MGTSFVTLGMAADGAPAEQGHQIGFWMRDADLELLLRVLALHVDDTSLGRRDDADSQAARSIRDQWCLAWRGGFMGCVPHGLEEIAATEGGLSIVRAAVASLMASLDQSPPVSAGDLQPLLGLGGPMLRDFDMPRLREAGRVLRDLIEGRIRATSRDVMMVPASDC